MTGATAVGDAFIAAIEQRNLDPALDLVADDVVYENVPMRAVQGREAVRATLGPFLHAASAVEWRVLRQVAEAGVVMNERLDRFRLGHRWVEVPVMGVFEVADGRIRLWRDYFDLATLTRQQDEV